MKLIEYEGKIAATLGGYIKDLKKPVERLTLWVSDVPAQNYAHCIGLKIRDIRGSVGMVWPIDAIRPVRVDMTGWECIVLSRPVKKQREGKTQGCSYDWEWVRGQWQRIWLD